MFEVFGKAVDADDVVARALAAFAHQPQGGLAAVSSWLQAQIDLVDQRDATVRTHHLGNAAHFVGGGWRCPVGLDESEASSTPACVAPCGAPARH